MNGNDLMNALSGLDPKYIDEAAFELHGKPQVKSEAGSEVSKKKASVTSFRKYLPIILPAAAAILLTVAVAMPMILRLSNGNLSSSTAPKSDSVGSAEAPSYYAEAPEASYDAEAEAPAAENAYGDEETAGYSEFAAEAEVAEDTMPEDAAVNAAAEAAFEAGTEAAKTEGALSGAVYFEGYLILHTDGALPADPGELTYTIRETGEETILYEGILGDALTNTEPLTLDLTSLELPSGSYTLTIGDESIEFTV